MSQRRVVRSVDGKSFIIHDIVEFESNVLPYFFKHNKMTSFVRQLNVSLLCWLKFDVCIFFAIFLDVLVCQAGRSCVVYMGS